MTKPREGKPKGEVLSSQRSCRYDCRTNSLDSQRAEPPRTVARDARLAAIKIMQNDTSGHGSARLQAAAVPMIISAPTPLQADALTQGVCRKGKWYRKMRLNGSVLRLAARRRHCIRCFDMFCTAGFTASLQKSTARRGPFKSHLVAEIDHDQASDRDAPH